jgi:hypothetical protein
VTHDERQNRNAKRRAQIKSWRFGVGQTFKEEGEEIRAAQDAGIEHEYMHAQRWARMCRGSGGASSRAQGRER